MEQNEVMSWFGKDRTRRWLQRVCQGYPLSEEVCGAVEGERRLRAVEVQDRSERSERSEASEAGRKRWTKPSRKSCCCWVMAWEMRQGSACRLPVTESSLSSNVPMRLSSSSLRSCSSDTRSYITFWVFARSTKVFAWSLSFLCSIFTLRSLGGGTRRWKQEKEGRRKWTK